MSKVDLVSDEHKARLQTPKTNKLRLQEPGGTYCLTAQANHGKASTVHKGTQRDDLVKKPGR